MRYASGEELLYLMIAGDLNPYLQAQLPAALAAARAGDDALLLRLRAVGQGGLTPLGDLSFGLNVTTGCTDGATPYPLSVAPGAPRAAAASAALAAVPPSQYAPFDAATVQAASYGDDCLLWPQDPEPAPAAGPLPDVPALLLGGGLDLRTPVENARATAAELPHASVVEVDGTGHDVLDTDATGCATVALERFAAGRRVGRPCRGRSNAVGVTAVPPRTPARVPRRPGRRRPSRSRGVRRPGHAGGRARDVAGAGSSPVSGCPPAACAGGRSPRAPPGRPCGCAPTPTCGGCGSAAGCGPTATCPGAPCACAG